MPLLDDEKDGLMGRFIKGGWKVCLAFLVGGLVVFLTMCSKIGGVN